jgi:hypothetical protein
MAKRLQGGPKRAARAADLPRISGAIQVLEELGSAAEPEPLASAPPSPADDGAQLEPQILKFPVTLAEVRARAEAGADRGGPG